MNLLIVSPGRRVEIVEAFKEKLNNHGRKVFTLDMSKYAPALYVADDYFIIEKDFSHLEKYVKDIIKICKENDISWLLTLIDPELELFKNYEGLFADANIKLLISDKEFIYNTIDKYKFYTEYKDLLPLVDTFINIDDMKSFYDDKIPFPLMAKDRLGSASIGLKVIKDNIELDIFEKENSDFIIQRYIDKIEYGIDIYFDLYTHKIVDIFMKEKLSMRAGETDKSLSIWTDDVYNYLKKLESIKGLLGTIDVDVFIDKETGEIFINEINPRFGGGYFHAHSCGCDYVEYTVNNMLNNKNQLVKIPKYKSNILMLKYNNFFLIEI